MNDAQRHELFVKLNLVSVNPIDHPHGGGEGKCPVGRDAPRTPWGKRALGIKTRSNKKASSKLIVRRRNGK